MDLSKCWRATEFAQFADADINASRAYELPTDGDGRVRTIAEVIAQGLAVPDEEDRTAVDLLERRLSCRRRDLDALEGTPCFL
ncbi:hypothetical protein [Streptomyces sp. NPDC001530]|uniref:hypothetical protein n=1 Tax=Streptomyces sp. NPDC001530 TaxID=3364582 RepID=UPI0036A6E628